MKSLLNNCRSNYLIFTDSLGPGYSVKLSPFSSLVMDILQIAKINSMVVALIVVLCVLLAVLWFVCNRTSSRRKGDTMKNYHNDTELKQVKNIFKCILTPQLRLSQSRLFIGNSTASV